MITLLHASDIHFGEPHLPEVARAFLSFAHELAPDVVVISGDLTQRAKVGEFQEAAAFLQELPDVPLVVTPGNHDIPLYRVWERLTDPFGNYRAHIRDELDTVTRIPGMIVVALNSASPYTAIVNGRIGGDQLDLARAAFASGDPADVKVLVAHHHLAPAPDYEGDNPLPRAREILDELTSMGVELVLGGHLHRAYIVNSLDVRPGRQRDQGVVIVHSGTTTSARGRARERLKNSLNVIRVSDRFLDVSHHLHHSDRGEFAPLSRHLFPRRPAALLPEELTLPFCPDEARQ
jgi:3',5'-cyclic AMP phosphodiesterase CpdA